MVVRVAWRVVWEVWRVERVDWVVERVVRRVSSWVEWEVDSRVWVSRSS